MSTERVTWTSIDGAVIEIDRFVATPVAGARFEVHTPEIAAAERVLRQSIGSSRSIAPMLLRSEGIASSRIEGLAMSTRRIMEARFRGADVDDPAAGRILANIELMSEIIASPTEVSPALITALHGRLMAGDPQAAPGRVRSTQNWIGGGTLSPAGAVFIPPGPEHVSALLDDLCVFANRVDLNAIVQAAVVHAQFETIHPFADGTGRIGRALIYWVLARRGMISDAVPAISPIVVQRIGDYTEGLTAYRNDDLGGWVSFLADVIAEAVAYTQLLARALEALAADWRRRTADLRADSVAHRIVDGLVGVPIVNRRSVADDLQVSGTAATTALEALVDRLVLAERPLRMARRGRPGRVYEATELFALLDAAPNELALLDPDR